MGCKTNHYETDAVTEQFRTAGFEIVPFNQIADVYVLNTCTVTAEADRKSRQFLRRARGLNPQALVVAMGCHVELGADNDTAFADIIVGTRGKSRVVDQVLAWLGTSAASEAAAEKEEEDIFEEFGAVTQQSETRAYIKIEDGCDSFCTYCAIPFARGRVRSRDSERVIEEATQLAAAGFREIVLTGIHICSYGAERGQGSEALPELAALLGRIEGIERIRFGSLEPQSVTPLFVARCAEVIGLCPQFHLSLQS
ncbi:MAG: radical SAM protein, partial [Ruminococcaceae bacterium]|nr:radical SAM protein [Oscillospiraceae bacterium]